MRVLDAWIGIRKYMCQTSSVDMPVPLSTAVIVVCLGGLLCGCSKVNITPLGSTSEGRQQFELTCNQLASEDGSCHHEALDVCGGDYETLDVAYRGPRTASCSGEPFTASGQRVLLIACHPSRRGKLRAALHR